MCTAAGWPRCSTRCSRSCERDAALNVVTARLSVRYRRPAPVGEELVFVGWIDDEGDRRVIARATCHVDAELVAEAEAEFVRI